MHPSNSFYISRCLLSIQLQKLFSLYFNLNSKYANTVRFTRLLIFLEIFCGYLDSFLQLTSQRMSSLCLLNSSASLIVSADGLLLPFFLSSGLLFSSVNCLLIRPCLCKYPKVLRTVSGRI